MSDFCPKCGAVMIDNECYSCGYKSADIGDDHIAESSIPAVNSTKEAAKESLLPAIKYDFRVESPDLTISVSENEAKGTLSHSREYRYNHKDGYRGEVSPKSRLIALIFCIFLGPFGAHKFYVGKYFMGLIYFLTAGFFGVAWIIDLIFIVLGIFKDRDGLPLLKWE